MRLLGIDPGTTVSGWVIYDTTTKQVVDGGVADNAPLLYGLSEMPVDALAIEVFEARGMPIGNESIETILFTGMLLQAWGKAKLYRVRRSAVKLHLCGSSKAKDGNIRQALIDLVGPQGKKSAPGPTYGMASHAWAALGVAVTAAETLL